ncbi:EamA family transporter [Haloferax sp. MBLA0076]|uniref:EamA family transporter n=1 Tax=Haloferax litoreum TaxID=2666140 RepID=A0A6A8GFH9_9EURY|nr:MULTISPECIES: EamA family transporter [Haloferax]KAB1193050.1 EamA family transporter [Haloferax sp. CBA1148]MRX21541.1 EamA family transporter [Haloferax litoreum]
MSRHRTLVLFVAAAVLFGTSFVGIKAAIGAIPPVLFAAFRVDVAAVVLLTLVAVRGGYWRPRTRADVLGILVSAAFVLGANNVLLFLGQQNATSGAAAVMYSILPIASPMFAVFLLDDERISAVDAVGILFGLAGVVVIVGPQSVLGGGSVGQALVAGAALSVAFGTVLLKRVAPTIGTIPMTAWAMAVAGVGIHAVSLGLGELPSQVAWSPTIVAAILYVGMPATAAAYPVYFALLAEAGPVRGNLVAYAMPIVATLSGWAFLGESISAGTVLGFGVIVSGFLLVHRESVANVLGTRVKRPAETE